MSDCANCQWLDRLELYFPKPMGKRLGETVKEVLQAKQSANRRKRYVDSLRQYLMLFSRGRETMTLDAFQPQHIEAWFVERKEAPATRASNLGRLSALFNYAWRRGYIPRNPCDQVERITVETKTPQVLTVPQADRCIRFTSERWQAYVALALFAGVRPEEMEKLSWDNVNFDNHTLTISAAASKVHMQRIVPLPGNCVAWLKLARNARLPVPRHCRRRILYRLRFLLGVETWPVDVLRHTAASNLLAYHQDVPKVALMLGNSPKILMRHYWSLTTPEQAKAFFSIYP